MAVDEVVSAQDRAGEAGDPAAATTTPPAPVATLLGGMKDLQTGMQGGYYLTQGRFSVFAGVGYVLPDPDDESLPKGTVLTGGGRAFTSGLRHRGFVELSCGPLARVLDSVDGDGRLLHGPSLMLGYQHVANSGLTLLAAGGVGHARCAEQDDSLWSFELRLGVGYTWRLTS